MNEIKIEEKVYFIPGDHVTLKHNLENKPKMMLVKEKVERSIKDKDGNISSSLVGIKCLWFNTKGEIQEAVFSTKDLIKI